MTSMYLFEQFVAIRLYTEAVKYSPDGATIAYVANTTGQFNLWTVPSGGGMSRQITSLSDRTVRTVRWSADSETLAFNADQNGNEQHTIDATGGWPQALTDNPQAQHNLSFWSEDGRYLGYAANDRSPGDMDVCLRDMQTGEVKRLTEGGLMFPIDLSPDGRFLLIVQVYGNTNMDTLLYDMESGECSNLTAHEGETIFQATEWKSDGSGFFMLSNKDREFSNIAFYDLEQREMEWYFTPDADVENMVMSAWSSSSSMKTAHPSCMERIHVPVSR